MRNTYWLLLIVCALFALCGSAENGSVWGTGEINQREKTVLGYYLKSDGTLEIQIREYEPCFAATSPPCPGHTRVYAEFYAASNGVIVLAKTNEAIYEPEKVIKESIIWTNTLPSVTYITNKWNRN